MIATALSAPERKIWYISPFRNQSKDIAWKLLKKYLPKELIRKSNETELTLELINNSEIALKGADHPENLLGVGLHFVVLDEYASMRVFVWEEIVRPMLTDTLGKALFIGTPKGKNHLWELFLAGERGDWGYKSWRFQTIDNPYIEPTEIDQAKSELNERYFRQEYEASFEDYTGLVYPEFKEKEHVVSKFPDLTGLSSVIAIDPALTGRFAYLQAFVDNEDRYWITKEYYELDKRVSEVEASMPRADIYFADPNVFTRNVLREGKFYSLADEFTVSIRSAESDKIAGINRVAEYLKKNKIKIHPSCKNLIWELERYHWSRERITVRGVSKPEPYKKDDHLCDCLRYIIMSRWMTEVVEEEVKPERKSLRWYDTFRKSLKPKSRVGVKI